MAKRYELTINGKPFRVEVQHITGHTASVRVNDTTYQVEIKQDGQIGTVSPIASPAAVAPGAPDLSPWASNPSQSLPAVTGEGDVIAPLSGLLLAILVDSGTAVKVGQTLAQIEAMKMENNVVATLDGIVRQIHVRPGQEVQEGEVLMVIE